MSLKHLKLVTFDATNTLLKFKMAPWQYYAMIASEHGFNGTADELKIKMKDSFKKLGEKHPNFGKNTITWEKWWREIISMTLKDHLPSTTDMDTISHTLINDFRTAKCWYVVDGGISLIDLLKNLGLSVGIISNFDPRLKDVLRDVNLSKYLDFILTSYDAGYSKPDERIFRDAIKLCQKSLQPSEALHIGDDIEKDYEGARGAGWHALLINPDINTDTLLTPDHVFKSIKEFSNVIKQSTLKL